MATAKSQFARWLQSPLFHPQVVLTSIRVAAIVGSLLFCINHGPALIQGKMTRGRWIAATLTYLVPYCVSTHGQWSAQRRLP